MRPSSPPVPIEECALFDVGSTCLLAATIMRDAPGALAIWDVSGDTTEVRPRFFGHASMKGWALAVATSDVDAEVYFTAHELGSMGFDFEQSSFWRWTSSTGVATWIFDVPGFVETLAVATRTSR